MTTSWGQLALKKKTEDETAKDAWKDTGYKG